MRAILRFFYIISILVYNMAEKQDVVSIGDFLGVVEEYIPGPGTYEVNG